MTPRSWFALALRILGVWVALDAIQDFTAMANVLMHLYNPAYTSPTGYFVYGAVKAVMALILLKGAPLVALHFYPSHSQQA